MEELNIHITHSTCGECGETVKPHHRFCFNCGAFLGGEGERIDVFNNSQLRHAFVFYSLYLFICLMVKYTEWFGNYDHLFWIELLLAAITVSFAIANRRNVRPLLSFRGFSPLITAGIVLLAILFSFLVNLLVHELNVSLFHSDVSFYRGYRIYIAPRLLMVYSIALMPALFEELAFRGVLYGYLAEVMDEKLVMIITGFIFAAMHLNFISLIWLIPFGIFLGFLRKKYHTLWYGVIFHFVFNLVACLIDLYNEGVLF
ncbi:CPBP family intramembrane glutamic endopeptidase [Deminuibacter soli]|uniref:CPBP family intramembrane metalloprotease n=1 Tax=Deminuibacter soli TaxID=2291815 RepID=A0A3E1NRQ8_9BACT|nr:CPBP family intramembrane glutamic endopeptidase [Deminuibacter soli]RFM30448.1 CPBP family intramembrane metalloprotease [Deminuibacter soli]